METLSDELFEAIYGLIEEELEISTELVNTIVEYSTDAEQEFYLKWLEEFKSIL